MARRTLAGALALASLGAAAPGAGAAPLVRVDDLRTTPIRTGAVVVNAAVTWNAEGARDFRMGVGDLRLVTVTPRGHRARLLAARTVDVGAGGKRVLVRMTIRDRDDVAAMREGNRVVLTASQHPAVGQVGRSTRTYVTVGQLQPYGVPQPHIGTGDCSDVPIRPGAILNRCDLVGADLDGAQVSIHDPKSRAEDTGASTRLMFADLSGASMVRADLSGASVAGGRLNDALLRRAVLDNLSLAGASAVGVDARGATSDALERDSAANLFATDLREADLRETVFKGVSFARARLDDVQGQGATWRGVLLQQARLVGANFTGATFGPGSSFYFARLERTGLADTDVSEIQLAWSLLCGTVLPPGVTLDRFRDCRYGSENPTVPAPGADRAEPWVRVGDASLDDGVVRATVTWDAASRSPAGWGMYAGTVRTVAVDGRSGRARVLDSQLVARLPETTTYRYELSGAAERRAVADGNRVVVTATQHPPKARFGSYDERAYVTVETLQRGAGRGRVGHYDCSRFALVSDDPAPGRWDYCDLVGADLSSMRVGARFMRMADLSAVSLDAGAMAAVVMDGSDLAGFSAAGATIENWSLVDGFAPELTLTDGVLRGSLMLASSLDDANLEGTRLWATDTFAGTPMRRAKLGKVLDHTDLAFTDLAGASLRGAAADTSSLFLADLTNADLGGSTWTVDESGTAPWRWATLCGATMPRVPGVASGDRDCPR